MSTSVKPLLFVCCFCKYILGFNAEIHCCWEDLGTSLRNMMSSGGNSGGVGGGATANRHSLSEIFGSVGIFKTIE